MESAAAGAAPAHAQTGRGQPSTTWLSPSSCRPRRGSVGSSRLLELFASVKMKSVCPPLRPRLRPRLCPFGGGGLHYLTGEMVFLAGAGHGSHRSGYGAADPETPGGDSVGHHRTGQPAAAHHRHLHQRCHLCKAAITDMLAGITA